MIRGEGIEERRAFRCGSLWRTDKIGRHSRRARVSQRRSFFGGETENE
jgi:hypothetical protein